MRILWFNWRDWTHPWAGGAEVHVREVARRLVEWGHEVTLFCGRYLGCEERQRVDGVEVIREGNPFTVYLCAAKEYVRSLRRGDYDVVVDDINGVPFFTPLYVRGPKVAIAHHLVKEIFFQQLPMHKAVVGYLAERTIPLLYHDTPFIAVSESTKDELLRFGIPERNITVVHYGLDHRLLGRCGKSPYPTVLYFNRIKRYKNVDDLIKAFGIVKRRISDARLLIVGCKGWPYEGELRALARSLAIRDIEFLGFVSEERKRRILGSSWVHVLPSTREGWGISVMEAAACGTPTVAYDVPGLCCSVRNGETGILVPYRDVEALAEAMLRILNDEGLRESLSMDAVQRAKGFDWEKTADRTLKRLKSAVDL